MPRGTSSISKPAVASAAKRLSDFPAEDQLTLVSRLFARIDASWPGQWTARWSETAVETNAKEWKRALQEFTLGQFDRALAAARRRHLDFPPTLPQFSELCREARAGEIRPDQVLPSAFTTRRTEAARTALKDCYQMLGLRVPEDLTKPVNG